MYPSEHKLRVCWVVLDKLLQLCASQKSRSLISISETLCDAKSYNNSSKTTQQTLGLCSEEYIIDSMHHRRAVVSLVYQKLGVMHRVINWPSLKLLKLHYLRYGKYRCYIELRWISYKIEIGVRNNPSLTCRIYLV